METPILTGRADASQNATGVSRLFRTVTAHSHQPTDGTSVSLTGTRSPDDRRRRRLAVSGEGADAGDLDAGGVGILRERIGELPAASPWLPREAWKLNVLLAVFWMGIAGIASALIRPLPPHPQIAPAVEHLTAGVRPVLGIYAEIALWTLAGQFAALVGWYRSHSQLDFQGRYRIWAWAAAVLTAWGFFAGTSLHTAVAAVAGPQLRWPLWRADVVVWLIPAGLAGLSVWWLIDRDLRRNRLSLWLVRASTFLLASAGAMELFAADLATKTWFEPARMLCHWIGAGLMASGLWNQAWYVAYLCADPPEAQAAVDWRARASTVWGWFGWLNPLSWLGELWPFRRRTADAAKSKRRTTKKKDEEEESEEDAAPKRRRKPAAKKRTAKPRTRVKPEPEYEEQAEGDETEYDEESAEESWDESAAESDEEWTEEYEEEQSVSPVKTANRNSAPTPTKAASPPAAKTVAPQAKLPPGRNDASDDDDSDDDEDANYRVDGGESGSDMFKGLSKRQRRELRKQMKDQQRQNRG